MRENLTQTGSLGEDGRHHIAYDWYSRGIPSNVAFDPAVYLDTSYGFAAFASERERAMIIGKNTGCYDRATFITGKQGQIIIGSYTIINGATIISSNRIEIGNHCMLAWGVVITDNWPEPWELSRKQRAALMEQIATDKERILPRMGSSKTVILKNNCWIGFDAVILPGVTVGEGAIVGSKAVVNQSVPDYAVVAGNPARVIKYLR